MYREILQILRCPKCNEELALITEKEEDSEIIAGKLKSETKNPVNKIIVDINKQ